jgi:hypothetical protein
MESIKKTIEDLLISLEKISKTQIDIVKLKTIKTTSILTSSLIRGITIIFTVSFSLIFTGIASALYLGDLLNNLILGFLIAALGILLIGIISISIMAKTLKKSIGKYLIKTMLNP